ncbi:LysR substrate-binding domain-containing protein [Tateyamaria sp. SN6-1]|uniref:LysR substrate-binding domain-containing protein n=1 Tax=Tateyamaria sp. SN6-1 TaxID=3092148 RepID=UPI0039F4BAA1
MPLSLKAMQYFNAAVAFGSIAKAADHLNIAASAVSAAIDQVEDAFDLTLVTRRRSRGIAANASGRLIAQRFESLMEEYSAILADGAQLKHALSGVLKVGYYAPVAPAFLPEVFASFLPANSDAVLHLEECDNDAAQAGLLNGDFDVILFVSEGAMPAIDFDVLIDAPPFCLVPASHALARQSSVTLAELAHERLVVLNRPVAADYYQALFRDHAVDPRIAAYANSTEMVRSLVSRGLGCAVLNMRPGTDISYAGGALVSLPISDTLRPLTLSIAYDRARPRRIVQLFVEAAHAYFDEHGHRHCVVRQ